MNQNRGNMKHVDKFFRFPVRIYDGFSLTKAMVAESVRLQEAKDISEVGHPEDVDWVMGWARVPAESIVGWLDHFEEGTPVKQVSEKGFEMTMVITDKMGNFECVWDRNKFEQKLNEFVDNIALEKK